MEDHITATLYHGYLALENGEGLPPVLVAKCFHAGDEQYRLKYKYLIEPPSIALMDGAWLYVATEKRQDDNEEQYRQLLAAFQNPQLEQKQYEPQDWAFFGKLDLQDKQQLAVLQHFGQNAVTAFLLYPEKASNHSQAEFTLDV